MYFSISAPQSVTLPNGQVLHFRVNPVDTSLCELHVAGKRDGEDGTHILTIKRNGIPVDDTFVATPDSATAQPKTKAAAQPDGDPIPDPTPMPEPPLPYASVNDGAVRTEPAKPKPSVDTPPAA